MNHMCIVVLNMKYLCLHTKCIQTFWMVNLHFNTNAKQNKTKQKSKSEFDWTMVK